MTQTEYKQKRSECWEEFKRENLDGEVQWQPVSRYDVFCDAFDRAYALGKQVKDAEDTVISGWMARDEDGRIYLYDDEPKRENGKPYGKPSEWGSVNVMTKLSVASFPDLSWSDEPQEVEIIIKRKKK